jgi:hypothetical protein
MAAAAISLVPDLNLSKPKKGKTARFRIEGHEATADRIRELQLEIDSLTSELKAKKETLLEAVNEQHREQELAGTFHQTVEVMTTDGKPVKVVYQNRFSKVDIGHREALVSALNGQYQNLFTEEVTLKARDGVRLAEVRAALGNRFDTLLEGTEVIAAKKDFRQRRQAVRSALSDETNALIDSVVTQMASAPQVKVK